MVRTRARDYVDFEAVEAGNREPSPPPFIPQQENAFDRRRRWSALLHQHDYRTVITEVLDQELHKYITSKVIDPTDLASIMSECVLILASAPAILTAAVDGVLTHQYQENANLQSEYAVIQERAHMQPSIYIHLLADELGVAPTPNQYVLIQEAVAQYIDSIEPDNAFAFLVDNITPPHFPSLSSNQGYRKYLRTASTPRSPSHVTTFQRFCAGVHKLHSEIPTEMLDTPLQFPPGECGYALHSHKRLRQHSRRQSSNYVMNLIEDICTHLHRVRHPQFEHQRFFMHQFIIYLIFRPSQAEIAEIFCSGLLQVWVDGGGGFNAYPAGRSNSSARRLEGEAWSEFERFAVTESGLVENLERQRIIEAQKALEAVALLNLQAARLWAEVLASLEGYTV